MNKKEFLRAKEAEIVKAGRMVFDAIFGDSGEFQKKLEAELASEEQGAPEVASGGASQAPTAPPATLQAPRDAGAIDVPGYSFVRCVTCGRELVVPPDMDARVLTRHGWALNNGQWRCVFCVGHALKGEERT